MAIISVTLFFFFAKAHLRDIELKKKVLTGKWVKNNESNNEYYFKEQCSMDTKANG